MYVGKIKKSDVLTKIGYQTQTGELISTTIYPDKLSEKFRVPADQQGRPSHRWIDNIAREVYMFLQGFRYAGKEAPMQHKGPTFDVRGMESKFLIEAALRNSWIHGNGTGSDLPLIINTYIGNGFATSIKDHGKGFDPDKALEMAEKKFESGFAVFKDIPDVGIGFSKTKSNVIYIFGSKRRDS